ncbi:MULTISPECIES: cation diffusion facilitator family transporter [unclassified Gordonia (in: high G+C Gram-positive bacteria)]|uniref:cation diffusion facilitator family transporter n=1 Tax=unclassified Gordonia (in: high G+C Gram-positive bacteria) TaxID=2657482 RepID=UPI000990D97C|nr:MULTISPECIES: cation diffusion facilitator family transporter [unclassified Gordonia (in: high G+C Gram-positive bacteria)]MCX2753937.1 cation diffusion facilitator family transporter [Gordonia sp. 4N]MDT0220201.1 cation diffusion facilitator family transporter [Gordonia sp. AC31]
MGHSHSHSHAPAAAAGQRRLWPMVLAVGLIGGYFVVELVTGILVNSLALIADAGHMLTDVVALVMGLIALLLGRHGRITDTRSFGWHRAEVFTAVANAVLLMGVAVFVLYEAVERIGSDPQVPGLTLIVVALIGLLVNLGVMLLLRADAKESIAVRGAYLEVLADAVGSVGVLIAGVVAMTTGWGYADIVVAVLIALWVVPRAVRLALDALRILNQQAPAHIDVEALRADLADIPVVDDVHDLHVWTLTTGMDVATVHLGSSRPNDEVLPAAQAVLARHGLEHATVQIDPDDHQRRCRDEMTW